MLKSEKIEGWIRRIAVILAGWLGIKYLLPVALPFLAGGMIALAAEPAVRLLHRRLGLPRGAAAGFGVSATLIFLMGLVCLIGALAVKELRQLAQIIPDARQTLREGVTVLENAAVDLAARLPEGIRHSAGVAVTELFQGGAAMTREVTRRTGQRLTALLGKVPKGLLGVGTGLLSGYMISARMPRLRRAVAKRLPSSWNERYLPALRSSKEILGGWFCAQGKLAAVTAALLAVGFALLRVPYGFLWAVPVALVDAVPVLGTGVVLVPWAMVSFLRGNTFQGVGLLVLCAAAIILRRVLEPKWVGRHLDLDPLTTLVLFYLGYCFWGIPGMILAPLLAAVARQLSAAHTQKE